MESTRVWLNATLIVLGVVMLIDGLAKFGAGSARVSTYFYVATGFLFVLGQPVALTLWAVDTRRDSLLRVLAGRPRPGQDDGVSIQSGDTR